METKEINYFTLSVAYRDVDGELKNTNALYISIDNAFSAACDLRECSDFESADIVSQVTGEVIVAMDRQGRLEIDHRQESRKYD